MDAGTYGNSAGMAMKIPGMLSKMKEIEENLFILAEP